MECYPMFFNNGDERYHYTDDDNALFDHRRL